MNAEALAMPSVVALVVAVPQALARLPLSHPLSSSQATLEPALGSAREHQQQQAQRYIVVWQACCCSGMSMAWVRLTLTISAHLPASESAGDGQQLDQSSSSSSSSSSCDTARGEESEGGFVVDGDGT